MSGSYYANDFSQFQYSEASEILNILLPLLITLFIVVALLYVGLIVNYILRGVGILKLSKKLGVPNGWLGFIPIASEYQLGALAGNIELGKKRVKNPGVWLVVLPFILAGTFLLVYIPMIIWMIVQSATMPLDAYGSPDPAQMVSFLSGFIIFVLVFVVVVYVAQIFLYLFRYLVMHKIFSKFETGQRPVFYMILSMFVPFAEAILLLKQSGKPVLPEYAPVVPEYMQMPPNPQTPPTV